MRSILTVFLLVLSCAPQGAFEDEEVVSWHQRYVEDHCARCPECCVEITESGFIDEYGVERPLDWLPDDDSDEEVLSDRAENEDLFCTPDVCPGPCCPCVKGVGDLWWIDYTGFGTDDGDCED